ncbi:MAG: hypothetical protein L0I84_03610 [Halomonas subglaciescola]|nr:hypothetical protein [Halomonas subglaciescola]
MSSIPNTILCLCTVGVVALAGCGTPQYRAEKQHCEAQWMMKIPPEYRQEVVTRHRNEERLTGETVCKTKDAVTNCKQLKETVSIPYSSVERVDIKKAQRNPQITSCAARACMKKYGNRDCKI